MKPRVGLGTYLLLGLVLSPLIVIFAIGDVIVFICCLPFLGWHDTLNKFGGNATWHPRP